MPVVSTATLPQVSQEYRIAANFSLQIWLTPTSGILQYEQEMIVSVGLQSELASSAINPQLEHVWAMTNLLWECDSNDHRTWSISESSPRPSRFTAN
jgi:hypothetical protein